VHSGVRHPVDTKSTQDEPHAEPVGAKAGTKIMTKKNAPRDAPQILLHVSGCLALAQACCKHASRKGTNGIL
jgi:hypothetical protein